jgi:carbamoyl-phosphate synthase large subunit
VQRLNKIGEGSPHVLDWIERGDVDLVVNTPTGSGARTDGYEIRRAAVAHGIPCLTTLAAGISAARAIASSHRNGDVGGVGGGEILCLQELHGSKREPRAQPGAQRGAGEERAASTDGAGVA